MPDTATGEYRELSDDQKKLLSSYKDNLQQSLDFCKPYFDKFIRFYRLFAGALPPELESSFSKVMLQIPNAMVESELPQRSRMFFTADNWLGLEALSPEYETWSDVAERWLTYQMEVKQRAPTTFIAPFQSTDIFGIGYRIYSHKYKTYRKTQIAPTRSEMGVNIEYEQREVSTNRSIIVGQYASVFSILPAPVGGLVNDYDDTNEGCVPYLMWVHYKNETELKTLMDKPGWNKRQIEIMMRKSGSTEQHPAEEYEEQLKEVKGQWSEFSTPQWIRKARENGNAVEKQFIVTWWWMRNKWVAIGEGQFILYEGPPIVDCFPCAKFISSFDLNNWFGKGLIEVSEDLLLAINLNLNMRLDYLAGNMYPATWVPDTLIDYLGGDMSKLDPAPYSHIPYPDRIEDIQKSVWHDRGPEMTQQAFLEEATLTQFLQRVAGQPDVFNAINAGGRMGDIGASGAMTMIDQSLARSMLRAINSENTGVRDSAYLTMKLGAKFKNDDERVRIRGANGFPWSEIPGEAIMDSYGINIRGTRSLNLADETLKKMLMTAQIAIGNPAAPGQAEILRQILPKAGYENIGEIVGEGNAPAGPPIPPGGEQQPRMGGMPSLENRIRSRTNRQTVEAGTGEPVAAGNILV